MLKALLFDVDNTLLDFLKCSRQAIVNTFESQGVPFKEEYMDTFLRINNHLWDQLEKHQITSEELHDKRFTTILDELGIKKDGRAFEDAFVRNFYNSCEVIEGAEDTLAYLKDKYKLYIATNASYDEQHNRLSRAGLVQFFDKIFSSREIGDNKPSSAFFNGCLKELPEYNKDEIMIVGDSINADIEGGRNAGIKTCWFNKDHINKKAKADYQINQLEDLKKIL